MLTCAERLSLLGELWRDALAPLVVRHPNRASEVRLHLSGDVEPILKVSLDAVMDTRDQVTPMRSPFVISCVRLTFWPGSRRAREWFAAGWSGYVQHEALELVTLDGAAVLDPHEEPYATNPNNRGLRDGLPPVLTEATIARAMAVVR